MPEPTIPEERIKAILLTKVYSGDAKQLQADIDTQKGLGATSDLSAVKKLVRIKGTRTVEGQVDVTGRFLQLYRRRDRQEDRSRGRQQAQSRGFSAYLVNDAGISTIHFDKAEHVPDPRKIGLTMEVGEPQTWGHLSQQESVITGARWLVAPQGTTLAKPQDGAIRKTLWSFGQPVTRIKDGLGLWNGYVSGVFQVGEFDEEGNKTGNKEILGDDSQANLAVGITDTLDPKTGLPARSLCNVKIKTVAQLQTLLGDIYNEDLLYTDAAIAELRDSLNGTPVIVFGSGLTPQKEGLDAEIKAKMKRPTVNLSGGQGLIAPYTPDSAAA